MNSTLSNLDIPKLKSAAAAWALTSSLIEKITLHCSKRGQISTQGPSYVVILWVSKNVDLSHLPWKEQLKYKDGKPTGGQLKEQYRIKPSEQDDKIEGRKKDTINSRKIRQHKQYPLWNLLKFIDIEQESFSSFYQKDYKHPDPRYDWLVHFLNVGDEKEFRPEGADNAGGAYYDFDDTELGSVVLFPVENLTPPKPTPAGEAARSEIQAQEDLEHYIQRRRSEGEQDEIIAVELHDKKNHHKLTYIEIARKFGLDKDLQMNQFDALKKRGQRFCDDGKKILKNNQKRKKR